MGISQGVSFLSNSLIDDKLKVNNKYFYFDYKNGEYGYNTSSSRGADTFSPFKKVVPANTWHEIYYYNEVQLALNRVYTDNVAFTTHAFAYSWAAIIGVAGKTTFKSSLNLTNCTIGFISGKVVAVVPVNVNTDVDISKYDMLMISIPAASLYNGFNMTIK